MCMYLFRESGNDRYMYVYDKNQKTTEITQHIISVQTYYK